VTFAGRLGGAMSRLLRTRGGQAPGCELASGAPVHASRDHQMSRHAEFSKRGSRTGETLRMRIYSLHEDQIELIQTALAVAREASGTDYDSVALTNICMEFLATNGFSSIQRRLAHCNCCTCLRLHRCAESSQLVPIGANGTDGTSPHGD
jgi:hypothetical protein